MPSFLDLNFYWSESSSDELKLLVQEIDLHELKAEYDRLFAEAYTGESERLIGSNYILYSKLCHVLSTYVNNLMLNIYLDKYQETLELLDYKKIKQKLILLIYFFTHENDLVPEDMLFILGLTLKGLLHGSSNADVVAKLWRHPRTRSIRDLVEINGTFSDGDLTLTRDTIHFLMGLEYATQAPPNYRQAISEFVEGISNHYSVFLIRAVEMKQAS